MLAITDDQLINAIWLNQLRILPKAVLHKYIGGGVGLCNDDDFWFKASSSERRCSRQRVTRAIQKGQLLRRLKRLRKDGLIDSAWGDLTTFMVNNENAAPAFRDARKFWLRNGVPEGMEDGKCRIVKGVDVDFLAHQCELMLLEKYA